MPGQITATGIQVYETRDRKMILTLMSTGLKPMQIRKENNTLYFSFNNAEASSLVDKYLSGDPISVDIHQFWRAEDVFKSHLNGK